MHTISEYEMAAKQALSKMHYDFFYGGAGNEITLKINKSAYDDYLLMPRVLVSATDINTSISLLKQEFAFPILIAPTAFHGLAHSNGELETIKGANDAYTTMIFSTMANSKLEQTASIAKYSSWFQLYIFNDRSITLDLIKRAEKCHCKALVLTVDSQTLGVRVRDLNNEFALPSNLKLGNLEGYFNKENDGFSNNNTKAGQQGLFDKSLNWDDIHWIKQQTKLPLVLKGILHLDDAKLALKHGVDGLIISNHGGRQLDSAISPLYVLPQIKKIINNKIPLFIDGGITRGTDVFKAIALGADAVLIGRPIIWGLAVSEHVGVSHVLTMLQTELLQTMALMGFRSITEIKEFGHACLYKR